MVTITKFQRGLLVSRNRHLIFELGATSLVILLEVMFIETSFLLLTFRRDVNSQIYYWLVCQRADLAFVRTIQGTYFSISEQFCFYVQTYGVRSLLVCSFAPMDLSHSYLNYGITLAQLFSVIFIIPQLLAYLPQPSPSGQQFMQ